MDDAYRDRATAALARVEALERENTELRAQLGTQKKELRALRDAPGRGPDRHSGPRVVLGLAVTIGSIFGAAVLMYSQIRTNRNARPMPGGGVVEYPSPGHRYSPPPPAVPPSVPVVPAPGSAAP